MLEAGLTDSIQPPFGTQFTKLNIALDYDDTYTANKAMWHGIVRLMEYYGNDVRFVTARFETPNGYSNDEIVSDAERLGIPIIYCNGVQKATRCDDVGFNVDIWIDDFPVLIPRENELECILRGARVNDNKQRTVLNKEKNNDSSRYSDTPLVIRG
ncbi:UNVERIFIED_CONTAM: hypothetical protein RF648_19040 [Kocuria sp. CPCC 205274]